MKNNVKNIGLRIKYDLDVLFDSRNYTDYYKNYSRFKREYFYKKTIYYPEIVRCIFKKFTIDEHLLNIALDFCRLLPLENKNEYHNGEHSFEVFLILSYLLQVETQINKEVTCSKYIGLSLLSALMHDYNHDGKSNTVDGKHTQFRLEKFSFMKATSTFKENIFFSDLDIIKTLILSTDTSHVTEFISPHDYIKKTYLGKTISNTSQEITKELSLIGKDNTLNLMCLLLHEADIIGSSSLELNNLIENSKKLSMETGEDRHSIRSMLFFLKHICGGEHTSQSAKLIFQEQLAKNISILENELNDNSSSS